MKIHLSLLVMTFVLFLAGAFQQEPVTERLITINVEARSHDGAPLSNVAFVVVSDISQTAARTDQSGTAQTSLSVPLSQTSVNLLLFGGGSLGDWSDEERAEIIKSMLTLSRQYFLKCRHVIDLKPDLASYQVEIIGWPLVWVSGVVVDEDDRALQNAVVMSQNFNSMVSAVGRRQFKLNVRQSSDTTIFFVFSLTRGRVVAKQLSSQQTQAQLSLGKIVIESPPEATARIDPIVLNARRLAERLPVGYRSGITFVSSNGQLVYTFDTRPSEGNAEIQKIPTRPGEYESIPSGQYFLIPGGFSPTGHHVYVIEALLNGITLNSSSIPRVEIKAGELNTFEFDMLAAYNEIRNTFETTP